MTYVLSEDKKTITITTANKLAAGDYTVTVTPGKPENQGDVSYGFSHEIITTNLK